MPTTVGTQATAPCGCAFAGPGGRHCQSWDCTVLPARDPVTGFRPGSGASHGRHQQAARSALRTAGAL